MFDIKSRISRILSKISTLFEIFSKYQNVLNKRESFSIWYCATSIVSNFFKHSSEIFNKFLKKLKFLIILVII